MATAACFEKDGKRAGTVELPKSLFEAEVNPFAVHEAVVAYLANQRQGTVNTRERSDVRGGGKKPWRQKGTGRARQGSIRATQWKGGGKPFGPTPRSYAKDMPREMRRASLRAAVAAKIAAGQLSAVEAIDARDGKTKSLVGALASLGIAKVPTLLVVRELAEGLTRAARNVPWLTVETPAHVSVYQLLHAHRVVFERAGLLALEEALGK
jgi:large subunit ribosomal protein L4